MEYVDWFQAHYDDLIEIWGIIVLLASAVIKVIPALPENHWALPVVKFVGRIIALNTNAPVKRQRR